MGLIAKSIIATRKANPINQYNFDSLAFIFNFSKMVRMGNVIICITSSVLCWSYYSYFKTSTGLVLAALKVCRLMVMADITKVIAVAKTKPQIPMLVLYAK